MFKKILLVAVMPLALLASAAFANDDVLNDVAGLKVSAITDAQVSIDDAVANLDIDGLSQQAGGEKTDAVEACFRNFGYRGCGYGYGYGYSCYSYNYFPTYSYCYTPVYCYRPVYTAYYPVCYNYWGCY